VTEDELTIVREAHAAGKSAGEILKLLGNRHDLQHLIKKAMGSRHAQRDLIRRKTPTTSGRWSNAEKEVLARGISEGKTYWRIAEELGRSLHSVDSKAEREAKNRCENRPWSAEDNAMLRTLRLQGKSIRQMVQDMRRNYHSLYMQVKRLGLQQGLLRRTARYWTEEDVQILQKCYKAGLPDKVINEKLSFQPGESAVRKKRVRMGLTTWKFATPRTHWSEVDVDELRALAALQLSVPEMAAQLTTKRTTSAVYTKLLESGIKYTDDSQPRARWTKADVSVLRTLHSRGLGAEAIKDALSTSRTLLAVQTKMWKMKLYLSKGRETNEPTKNEDTTENILVKEAS